MECSTVLKRHISGFGWACECLYLKSIGVYYWIGNISAPGITFGTLASRVSYGAHARTITALVAFSIKELLICG